MSTAKRRPDAWEWRRQRAWELHQQGWWQKDIAAALGVSCVAVCEWIKRAREGGVQALRTLLWTEHLHPRDQERAELADPLKGLALLKARATANNERVRGRERLVGHVLPYITAGEARWLGLPVDPEHGWFDNLEGGAGALPEEYAHCYL
jgi:predicted transcriptional regulator